METGPNEALQIFFVLKTNKINYLLLHRSLVTNKNNHLVMF